MTEHNQTGQRADKVTARVTLRTWEWEVDHYTLRCGDCETNGVYDDETTVICPDCGRVLTEDEINTYATRRHEHRG